MSWCVLYLPFPICTEMEPREGNQPPSMPPKAKCHAIVHKLSQVQKWPLGRWAYGECVHGFLIDWSE